MVGGFGSVGSGFDVGFDVGFGAECDPPSSCFAVGVSAGAGAGVSAGTGAGISAGAGVSAGSGAVGRGRGRCVG